MKKNKLAVSIVIALSAALSMGVGCKSSSDDPTACEDLCERSSECGDLDVCLAECADVTESCPDEVAEYLECAEGNTDIECFDQTALGISLSCALEAAAVELCAVPTGDGDGDGGAGGQGGAGGATN